MEKLVTQKLQDALAEGLEVLAEVQNSVSGMVEGALPAGGKGASRDQVRTYFLALIVETTELMNELNWKPWKDSKIVKTDKVIDEFADILAFLGLIMLYLQPLGINSEDLAEAYAKKSNINFRRFSGEIEGYAKTALRLLQGEEEEES